VDLARVTEDVTHAWYAGSSAPPASGETTPDYTGLDTSARYSWLKAPRYDGQAVEVGPLARVLIAYGQGHADVVRWTDAFLSAAGLGLGSMHSVVGRIAARAIETVVIAEAMVGWASALRANLAAGDKGLRTTFTMPSSGAGVGLNEAPRGALGHWQSFSGGTAATPARIGNYQMVVPSTWNFGPRDGAGVPGPVEEALAGVPVTDAARPVEIIRTVHSFDPCIACAVHVLDRDSGARYRVQVG
jgi:[NiFe] hydrogenase large subunit